MKNSEGTELPRQDGNSRVRGLPHRGTYALFLSVLAFACSPARQSSPEYAVNVDLSASVRDLDDDDLEVSEPAAQRIEAVGAAALPVLDRALLEENAATRVRAAEIVGAIGDPAGVPLLVRSANDRDPAVREEVMAALGSLGDPRGRATIESALNDPDVEVRRAAAEACAKLCRSPQAFSRLAEMALNEQPIGKTLIPRQSVTKALHGEAAEVARAPVSEKVEAALSHGDSELRARASLVLVSMNDPRAPKALAEAARTDVELPTRVQVFLALGTSGDETAVPILRDALAKGGPVPPLIACRAVRDLAKRQVRGAAAVERTCPAQTGGD
jgi:HEAT repeat protein